MTTNPTAARRELAEARVLLTAMSGLASACGLPKEDEDPVSCFITIETLSNVLVRKLRAARLPRRDFAEARTLLHTLASVCVWASEASPHHGAWAEMIGDLVHVVRRRVTPVRPEKADAA